MQDSNNYNKNIGFLQIDARYTLATAFKNKETGETIPFDCVDYKLITFMIQRENYFKNFKRSRYYESWDTICVAVTGTSYRGSGSNRARIKKLMRLGLLEDDTPKSGKITPNIATKKHVADLDEVLKGWDIINEPYTAFNSDEAKAERSEAKQQRLSKARAKITKPTPEQPKIEHPQTPTVEQAPPIQQPQSNDDDNVWDPFEFDEPFADVEVITQSTPITPPPEAPKQQDINPFVLCRELLSTAKHGVYMQHKANLLRIGKLGAMVNAIKQGYVYNDVFHENSLEVVSGAIHAIYEHSQHEQLNDANVLLDAKSMLEAAKAKQEVTETFSNHLSSVVISEQSYEQQEPEDYIDDLPF
ncbi:hypothetical protein RJP03_003523 [Vibrio cholerae]